MNVSISEHRGQSRTLLWFHRINRLIGTGTIMLRLTGFGLSPDGRYFVKSVTWPICSR